MAENCCVVPSGVDGFCGVTPIDTSAAALTVIVVVAPIVPNVAVIVVLPVPTLVASPLLPAVLLIVATVAVADAHVTVPVMSCVLPSVYVPVAVNCFVVPRGIVGIAGVTAIDTKAAGVTVNVVEPVKPE